MPKKLIFSCLMLLFPISILAQKSVLFDFSKYSEDEEIPFRIEKEGIVLEFRFDSEQSNTLWCKKKGRSSSLQLNNHTYFTIEGISCEITAVTIFIVDFPGRFKVFGDDSEINCKKEKSKGEEFFGSSVKWIDISHKLYKKAGIMYLCSDQTSRTWIPA